MQLFSFNLNQDKLLKELSSDRRELKELYSRLIERNFYIGEADLKRKVLNDWQKEGLLPFTHTEKGWTRFSLIEYVWLRCISELRALGLPLEKIRKIKDFFFTINIEDYKDLFLSAIEGFNDAAIPDKEQVIALFKQKGIDDAIWLQAMQELQVSLFTLLLLEVLIHNHNLCFTLDKEDSIQVVVLGHAIEERKSKSEKSLNSLLDASFVLINLRKLVQGFFEKDSIKYSSDYILSFLKPKEKKIIEKIQKGGIKEITIRFNKSDEPTHIECTNSKITEETIGKVARLMKKGQYSTIVLQQQDGKLINYENKELLKL